jgi:hypothetical protein
MPLCGFPVFDASATPCRPSKVLMAFSSPLLVAGKISPFSPGLQPVLSSILLSRLKQRSDLAVHYEHLTI